jgi:hypothetical protein
MLVLHIAAWYTIDRLHFVIVVIVVVVVGIVALICRFGGDSHVYTRVPRWEESETLQCLWNQQSQWIMGR